MENYLNLSPARRDEELEALRALYETEKAKKLSLNMARGVPSPAQLDLTMDMMDIPFSELIKSEDGTDTRNYGGLSGTVEAKRLFSEILGVSPENIIVCGQSSLSLMYDCMIKAMVLGVLGGSKPWGQQGEIKFLCPAPGYDRHFRISQEFGMKLINIPMSPTGPDMDMVREYVENDPSVKGIWCVPKYSNPQGYTYSPETVEAFAALRPAADDFRIFWDNAYAVHCFSDEDDYLPDIFSLCEKYGTENMVYEFASTSKVTFPGAGVAVIAASKDNIAFLLKQMGVQIISYDKINMQRHALYLKDMDGVKAQMKKLASVIRPKFEITLSTLEENLAGFGIGEWTKPRGGYFVCYKGLPGTAARCVKLCADAGVKLTAAGAPFPYGIDPEDSTIRIAPTFPTPEQLKASIELFCLCQKIAALESLKG